ncbi:hypothetical protein [Microbacterium immunditiarum]|uniref:Uncharacterized protein n=1 Tax=Microbacterium immunditiarum TaxID=337480 RepID=A0A7Y9GN71_9MICO|nr:hypothetical protein [Microbacterium immunditiarum]NYE19609.1 hypothetical protein [Microbacterium immunditiarum]
MAIEHRRALRYVQRREGVFQWIVEKSTIGAVCGLVMTVIGVQTDGLALPFTVLAWFLFGLGILGLTLVLVAIVEQDRSDREEDVRRREDERRAALKATRRRPWWRRAVNLATGDRRRDPAARGASSEVWHAD